jgi:colanic acid/amylovoran biosynthesis glycosyltransferase
MKKIAYFKIGYLPLSETFVYEQIRNIKKYKTSLLCAKAFNLDKFPLDDIKSLRDLPPHLYLLNGISIKLFNYSPYFAEIIKKENFALLHALFGTDGLRALPYKKKFNIPLITDFRGNDATGIPSRRPGIYRQLFETGDLFLARCESMEKDLVDLGCPHEKILVHHSGIPVDRFKYKERIAEDGLVRVLFVGRLIEKKGADLTLRSFAEACKKYKDIELSIIGDGPEEDKLNKLIKVMDLNTQVRLLGPQSHDRVIAEMMASHILVLPSKTARNGDKEGIPNVLMEAMATGMPVLSTFHAGIPELVEHGKSGYLVPEDDQAALTHGLLNLIEAKGSWKNLGRSGREKVEKEFNIITQTEKLERIYDTIIL